ncbi:MAG: AI-2E family transporter [Oscillospiraceae bacterium]|nr:AI-2E family transporter [Oscillospiraceae bacterium]
MKNKKRRLYIDRRARSFLIVGAALIIIYLGLQNLKAIIGFINSVFSLISPFVWGVTLAYLLSLLMIWLERRLFSKIANRKLKRALSLTLSLIIAAAFITGFSLAVIPQLAQSITSLVYSLSGYLDNSEALAMGWAENVGVSKDFIDAIFGSWEEILKFITDWARGLIPGIAAAGVRVGFGVVKGFIALFVAIYLLADLERFMRYVRLVVLAVFGEKTHKQLEIIRLKCHKAFGGFLVGKIIDSLIVGILCFVFMLIFKMPYSPLISFIVGVTNMIPTFGPFIGGAPSVFIIFIVDPLASLWFGIFIIVLQIIDGNIIGPFILGDALGLSSIWILVSVVFFGSVWGVTGMIVGVPLFAVIYDISKGLLLKKLSQREMDRELEAVCALSEDAVPLENDQDSPPEEWRGIDENVFYF